MYHTIIIGSGAAGLSAALYSGRYRLKVLVISKVFGGESSLAGKIENYPGVLPTDGYELMKTMKKQGEALGVVFIDEEVLGVKKEGHCFFVKTKKEEYKSQTLILALGAEPRKLGLPLEKELTGKGVHYCVTCDGPLYTGKEIAIIGGGDSSIKGANLAAQYASKIYLITREKELKGEPINMEQLKKNKDKIEIIYDTEVKNLVGDKMLESIVLKGGKELKVPAVFVEIGYIPNTKLAENLGVELDTRGYIKVDNMMRTNIDGVFAAGDAVNHFGSFKQIITASATGAVAATSAYGDYKVHGELCPCHALPCG